MNNTTMKKFRMFVDEKITNKLNKKTLSGLKEFRQNNWESEKDFDSAYKKYIEMYLRRTSGHTTTSSDNIKN